MTHIGGPYGKTEVMTYIAWVQCACGRMLTASGDTEMLAQREVARKLAAHVELQTDLDRQTAKQST